MFLLDNSMRAKKAAYSASAMQRVRMLLRVHLVDIKCPVQTDLIQPERNPLVSSLNLEQERKYNEKNERSDTYLLIVC